MAMLRCFALLIFANAAAAGVARPSNAQLANFLWHSKKGVVSANRADVPAYKKAPPITVVYENFPESCGSGGCVLDIVALEKQGLRLIGRETIVWPPITLTKRDGSGFPVFGVSRHGGGDLRTYCDELHFNGRKYVSQKGSGENAKSCASSKHVLIKFVGFQG